MSGIVNSTGARSGVVGTTVGTPAAAILQLLSTTITAATANITTSDSWEDLTGMTATITPSSTSNKIFVSWIVNIGGGDEDVVGIRMVRDSTVIGAGDAAGSRYSLWGTYRTMCDQSYEVSPMSGEFLDSPSSTSATVYKLQWILPEGSSSVFMNRAFSDADNADRSRSASTITIMEVSA